jgi:uncharacterized protein (DUF1800 family)
MSLSEYDKIAHVLRRAGFGAHPDEIDRKVAQGLDATVDELINFERFPDVAPDPEITSALNLTPDEFRNQQRGVFIGNVARWWLNAMITSQRPLQEKIVLFWHHLFATNVQGTDDPRQMYLQIENFRGNFEPDTGQLVWPNPNSPFPAGNFRRILEYLTKDPAMMFWLDNVLNRRLNNEVGSNENYARELHELFSMGVRDPVTGQPNYTEQDIRQASRALTGWSIRRAEPTFRRTFFFNSGLHDFGPYEHLGQRGGTNADFIFDNIVQYRGEGQPQSAVGRFIGFRLFRFFGYHDPEQEIINALADVFDGRNGEEPYNIRNLLKTIFTPGNIVSEAFYSEPAFKAHVKSPTELVVGALRLLNFDRASGQPDDLFSNQNLARVIGGFMEQMGQQLMFPPDVSGWKEGANWVNTTLALARFNFASTLTAAGQQRGRATPFINVDRILDQNNLRNAPPEPLVDFFTRLLLQAPVSSETRQSLIDYLGAPGGSSDFVNMKVRGLIHLIMTTPEFHLS